jgi:hypothetical protein
MSLTAFQQAVRKISAMYEKGHVLCLNEYTVKTMLCNIEKQISLPRLDHIPPP